MKHVIGPPPPRLTADQLRQLIAAEKEGVRLPCFLCGEPVLDQKFLLGTEDENDRLLVNSPCLHSMTYGAQLAVQVEAQMRMEAATLSAEPVDVCRQVVLDGETVRVRGAGEMSSQAEEALAAVVRMAKARMEEELASATWQSLRTVAINAVLPALQARGEWLDLTVRRAVADAVLNAVAERLLVGEEQAWCKACRRVWEGRGHRCESSAEREVAAAREFAVEMRQYCSPHGVAADYADRLEASMDRAKGEDRNTAADTLAAQWHRRYQRLEDLNRDPDTPATVLEHVRGELVGLRGALGVLLGGRVEGGTADLLGWSYYQEWRRQEEVRS